MVTEPESSMLLYKSLPLDTILSQFYLPHMLTTCFCKIHLDSHYGLLDSDTM